MLEPQTRLFLLIIGFIVASGFFDSLGLTYASNMWKEGRVIRIEAAKSGTSFLFGIAMYWVAVRYLGQAGIVTAELQTLIWLGATIVGVAILGGQFVHWQLLDQFIAVNVVASLVWLTSRAAA